MAMDKGSTNFSLRHETIYKATGPPDFEDERGRIHNILSDVEIKHIAIINSIAGSVRGNHYHPAQEQYVYVLRGIMESKSRHIEDGIRATWSCYAQDGDLLYCPPMVAHSYRAVTSVTFLNIDTGSRGEPGVDTIPFEVEKLEKEERK